MKALRHEAPFVASTAKRLKVDGAPSCAYVLKTFHTAHGGKLSLARVLTGTFADGTTVEGGADDERISGVFTVMGQEPAKRGEAHPGDTVAFGRLESVKTGDTLVAEKSKPVKLATTAPAQPVFGLAIAAKEKKDEVKLTSGHCQDHRGGSLDLAQPQPGHGRDGAVGAGRDASARGAREAHAQIRHRCQRPSRGRSPTRKPSANRREVRGRHKKQSGGHGQFGDVVVTISPRRAGQASNSATRSPAAWCRRTTSPRSRSACATIFSHGPLGFNVVDVAVCLIDGSYHSVDSSDMAFRQAGRIAMSEGLPQCSPVLLEPVMAVEIAVPSEATAKINGIISARRGQILGFDARPGWPGWDLVQAQIPEAEIQNLIVELRSATAGVGTFTAKFDHLAELTGKIADQVLASRAAKAA